ncbi:MAG: O-antigen ligase family protein [Gemmatimonadales bacterium]
MDSGRGTRESTVMTVDRVGGSSDAAEHRRLRALDLVGLALVLANAGWAVGAARISGGDPMPFAWTLLAAGLAAIVARGVGGAAAWLPPTAVAAAGAFLLVQDPAGILTGAPRTGPFGFSSITGAFYAQCAVGAAMVAAVQRTFPARHVAVVAAAGFAFVLIQTDTRSATALLVVLGAATLVARGWDRRAFVLTCSALFVGALGFTLVAGADFSRGPSSGRVADFAQMYLSDRRVGFWRDGLMIMVEHPLAGVGPGNFARFSPEALSDPDEPWAHNAFLQQGSETGVPGFALLLLLFLWAFARLAAARPSATTVLGAVALTSLAVQACIEYVLQRPAVPIAAAALLGSALAERSGRGPDPRL